MFFNSKKLFYLLVKVNVINTLYVRFVADTLCYKKYITCEKSYSKCLKFLFKINCSLRNFFKNVQDCICCYDWKKHTSNPFLCKIARFLLFKKFMNLKRVITLLILYFLSIKMNYLKKNLVLSLMFCLIQILKLEYLT